MSNIFYVIINQKIFSTIRNNIVTKLYLFYQIYYQIINTYTNTIHIYIYIYIYMCMYIYTYINIQDGDKMFKLFHIENLATYGTFFVITFIPHRYVSLLLLRGYMEAIK